jgi:endoglucanase
VGGEGLRDLYRHTQRAFYHQRCGFPLEEPYTRFVKPACHLEVYESGKMVADDGYTPQPGEAKRTFRGGYHDAADFDCFTYHLRANAQNLDAFAMFPGFFRDSDLNLPESGNGVPDLLDEAEWALRFWREQQTADGGVPKGRCNDQDSRRQKHVQWGPFGIFKPDPSSNLEYAAVAASFAELFKAYNADLAAKYLESAVRAFDWAVAQPDDPKDESRGAFLLWAAGALFQAAGEARFNAVFLEAIQQRGFKAHWKLASWGPLMRWPYVRGGQPGTDAAIQAKLRAEILASADSQLAKRLEAEAYRWGGDSTRGMGWGDANGGGHHADVLLRAWFLTREQKYLDAASLNADFQLGCNPLSKTFITAMGTRPPRHPQISAFLYEKPGKRGGTVPGITVYGLTDNDPSEWYPAARPRLRRWRDIGNGSAEISSEFTVTETLGASAMLYAALHALEQPPWQP